MLVAGLGKKTLFHIPVPSELAWVSPCHWRCTITDVRDITIANTIAIPPRHTIPHFALLVILLVWFSIGSASQINVL